MFTIQAPQARQSRRIRAVFLFFVVAAVGLLVSADTTCAGSDTWTAQSQAALETVAAKIDGAIVYQKNKDIYRTEIGDLSAVLVVPNGSFPRWSPDGEWIAFVRGTSIMRVPAAGGDVQQLARAAKPKAVAYHPNGEEVLFTDGSTIKAVNVSSLAVRNLASGYKFQELDISLDGTRLVATAKVPGGFGVRGYDLSNRTARKLANGCSASLSPDASFVTTNTSGHKNMHLLNWANGRKVSSLTGPSRAKSDNQFWSNNQDWIAAISESSGNAFLYEVSTRKTYQVTTGGHINRPDLFVRAVNQ